MSQIWIFEQFFQIFVYNHVDLTERDGNCSQKCLKLFQYANMMLTRKNMYKYTILNNFTNTLNEYNCWVDFCAILCAVRSLKNSPNAQVCALCTETCMFRKIRTFQFHIQI